MEKITITIEEIKSNPNLDISERIKKYSHDSRWSPSDLEELAIASIKADYEFWANNRANHSPRTDEMLKRILDGHILTSSEEFEMICNESDKVELYSKFNELNQRIADNNGITNEDYYWLCYTIGFDLSVAELLRKGYEAQGLIIDSYQNKETHYR